MEQDLFASFGNFGDHVFDGLDARDRSAQKFKRLLGVINNTLVETHGMVISRLTALRQAQTVDEAKVLLEKLRLGELSEAFRVEGLCDLLEGLGSGLYSRVSAARHEGYFSGKELTDMQTFAMMLHDREDEVARIYSTVLRDVIDQGRLLDQNSLPELRKKAAGVEALLTSQLSDFSEKANRFMRLSAS